MAPWGVGGGIGVPRQEPTPTLLRHDSPILHYHVAPLHGELRHTKELKSLKAGEIGVTVLAAHYMDFTRVLYHEVSVGTGL